MNRIKIFLILYIFLSPVFFTGCRKEDTQIIKIPPVPVRAEEVKKQTAVPFISVFGTVLYYSKADVYPTTEGYIETLYVKEGDYVEKGDILSVLRQEKLFIEREKAVSEVKSKNSLLRLAEEKLDGGQKEAEKKLLSIRGTVNSLKQKKLELENIKRIFSNKQQLFNAGGLSTEELEAVRMEYLKTDYEYIKCKNDLELIRTGYRDRDIKAKGFPVPENPDKRNELLIKINTSILEAEKEVAAAELSSSEAELRRIDLIIKETEIRSPVSGIIGKQGFDIGEKVKPDSKMFTVFKNSKVFIRIETGENLASEINKGMEAEIYCGSDSVSGIVEIISPVINPETRSREIKIIADNKNGKLVPGGFVRAKIKTGIEEERILVPEVSVVQGAEKNKSYIFIIRNNVAFKKEIKILFRTDKSAVIRDGLEPGEIVCIDPPGNLSDGREVRIIQ